jgi:hypothetical protein
MAFLLGLEKSEVEYGATWMNISWRIHCNIQPQDIINIERYIPPKRYCE